MLVKLGIFFQVGTAESSAKWLSDPWELAFLTSPKGTFEDDFHFPFPEVGYVIVEGPPKIKMSPKNGAVSEFCKEMLP